MKKDKNKPVIFQNQWQELDTLNKIVGINSTGVEIMIGLPTGEFLELTQEQVELLWQSIQKTVISTTVEKNLKLLN